MKRILITGANSYIGTSFEKYLTANYPNDYIVDTVDMRSGTWRGKNFSEYDCVFHVAGIAHSDTGKTNKETARLYYSVNTDLAIETAKKAKSEGVKQFIFMSSAIVYGESAPIGKAKIITQNTPVSPENYYADSKVQAENNLRPLNSDAFKVVILRPPMIYGKGSKGNYPTLAKIALQTPVFPYIRNERSMLYIENLCEFVHLMIVNGEQGTFHPQNAAYCNTSELVRLIAKAHKKKVYLVKGFSWALKLLGCCTRLVNKAFGNMSYEMQLSKYQAEYNIVGFEESIYRTEQ